MQELYERAKSVQASDPSRYAALLEKAAEQGHVEAAYELAQCYESGTGVEIRSENCLSAVSACCTARLWLGIYHGRYLLCQGIGRASELS